MAKQEKCSGDAEWGLIFDFIKEKMFQYGEGKKLPRNLILRVKGLAFGQYFRNTKQAEKAHHSLEVIYATCVYCADEVRKAFLKAKDESHKVNLLCFILDKYLNTMQERIDAKKANDKRIELLDNSALTLGGDTYVPKQKKKVDEGRW